MSFPQFYVNGLDTSKMFGSPSLYSEEDEAAFNNLKAAISEDIDETNQAIQAAGTPAEDQDPDAPPPGCDPAEA